MKSRIIPRLRRDLLAEPYQVDANARAARVSQELVRLSVSQLRTMGLRRASRPVPEPPYEPVAIALTPEAAAKLAQLPEGVSVSAIVQEILRR
ncbi:MAG: hypothetical protein ACYCUY_01325 [Acidithiobacillus sp.]|jgi:hypothetical protein|uniref:hypothetical protein n=1 Tax=Acidithiobacillus TaxID=119977 RepID=UPI001C070A76|nr:MULTISPECIES: hypothetical protein [Acidithiobacillus]MBU2774437.1 hypothetical protein [Acidithiobacillus ferrooxidans]MBW9249945.1 hypothetical protein [Acidithiobacillus ferriphilus]MBW9255271.1 hypothetical protein [Acidithiobacillus ferriphilus]MCR1347521.1 hypothetical protein [Acidithiobacillus ferrooxidans]MCR1355327.1 hypothetical protein [Acidithiobacillus ferrooxidans]